MPSPLPKVFASPFRCLTTDLSWSNPGQLDELQLVSLVSSLSKSSGGHGVPGPAVLHRSKEAPLSAPSAAAAGEWRCSADAADGWGAGCGPAGAQGLGGLARRTRTPWRKSKGRRNLVTVNACQRFWVLLPFLLGALKPEMICETM